MDPEQLYQIAEHQIDMAKKIRDTGGRPVLKEPHGGARKRTRDDIKNAKKQRR